MCRNRKFWPEGDERLRWDTRPIVALIIGVGWLAAAGVASAADAAAQAPYGEYPVAQMFAILFLMLGPFKVIGPFFKVTKGADPRLARRIAMWATIFSVAALLFAGFLGDLILGNFGIPLPVLSLAGGIILFLVALKQILEQFEPPEPQTGEVGLAPAAAMKVALSPLAFPAIVTPYGIAALIIFVAFSRTLEDRLAIGAVVVAIMLLNLTVMLVARRQQTVLSLALPIFGAVLGVVQVALGLQIINRALHALGVL